MALIQLFGHHQLQKIKRDGSVFCVSMVEHFHLNIHTSLPTLVPGVL